MTATRATMSILSGAVTYMLVREITAVKDKRTLTSTCDMLPITLF